jgi:hypothetical protein
MYKILCIQQKYVKEMSVGWGLCVSDYINVCGGGKDREHTPMVCVTEQWVAMLFSNVLLHTSQVYAYVLLSKEKNLISNTNLPVDCNQVECLSSTLQTLSVPWKLRVGWKNVKPHDKPLACEVEKVVLECKTCTIHCAVQRTYVKCKGCVY